MDSALNFLPEYSYTRAFVSDFALLVLFVFSVWSVLELDEWGAVPPLVLTIFVVLPILLKTEFYQSYRSAWEFIKSSDRPVLEVFVRLMLPINAIVAPGLVTGWVSKKILEKFEK